MRSKSTREVSWAPALQTAEYVKGRTITTGSLKRGIWKICWPLLVITGCISIVDLVHMQCAGYISSGAQAIIGICDQLLSLGVILLTAIATSAAGYVSRFCGKNSKNEIDNAAAQSIRLCIGAGIFLSLLAFFAAKSALIPFSGCIDDCNETYSQGVKYLNIASFTLIPFGLLQAINAVYMGIGETRVQLITMLTMTFLDVILNYSLFILDWPLKDVGIEGIATVSLISYTAACLVGLAMFFTSSLKDSFKHFFSKDQAITLGVLSNGLPSGFQEIAWAASAFVVYLILGTLDNSTEIVAALNIGQRLESFAMIPLTALGSAVLVTAGQNLGAGRAQRAWKSSLGALGVGTGLMIAAGTILYFFAPQFAKAIQASQDTLPHVIDYLHIAAFGLVFVGLEAILSSTLQALEDTRVPLLVGFVANWLIALPLTYLFIVVWKQGVYTAWLAMLIANVFTGLAILLRFHLRPEWKKSHQTVPPSVELVEAKDSEHDVSRGRPCQEIAKPALPEDSGT